MKKFFLAFGLLVVMAVYSPVNAQTLPPQVDFQINRFIPFLFVQPEIDPVKDRPRGPIYMPEVGQTEHTLYFLDETDLFLNIYSVDELGDEMLEYATAVPSTTTLVQLPNDLIGTYIIEVIRGDQYFRGEIDL